jgi:hypothetical protein
MLDLVGDRGLIRARINELIAQRDQALVRWLEVRDSDAYKALPAFAREQLENAIRKHAPDSTSPARVRSAQQLVSQRAKQLKRQIVPVQDGLPVGSIKLADGTVVHDLIAKTPDEAAAILSKASLEDLREFTKRFAVVNEWDETSKSFVQRLKLRDEFQGTSLDIEQFRPAPDVVPGGASPVVPQKLDPKEHNALDIEQFKPDSDPVPGGATQVQKGEPLPPAPAKAAPGGGKPAPSAAKAAPATRLVEPIKLTSEQRSAYLKLLAEGKVDEAAAVGANPQHFNYALMDGPEEFFKSLGAMAKTIETELGPTIKPRTFKESEAFIRSRLRDTQDISKVLRNVEAMGIATSRSGEWMMVLEAQLKSLDDQVRRMVDVIDNPATATDQARAEFIALLDTHSNVYRGLKGLQVNTARSLNLRKLRQGFGAPNIDLAKIIDETLENAAQGPKSLEQIAKLIKNTGDIDAGIGRFEKQRFFARGLYEYFAGSILSGPVTQAVNIFSNAAVMLYDPIVRGIAVYGEELYAGQGAGLALKSAIEETSVAYGSYIEAMMAVTKFMASSFLRNPEGRERALAGNAGSVWKNTYQALRTGDAQLVPSKLATEGNRSPVITGENFKLAFEGSRVPEDLIGKMASTVDVLGKVIRLPFRGLTTADEMFANLNYFMEARRQAFRAGRKQGLQGDALVAFMDDFANKADPATLKSIEDKAIARAKRNTFTTDLPDKEMTGNLLTSTPGVTKGFMRFVNTHPTFKLIFPFIQIPTNIMSEAVQNSPLAPLSQRFRNTLINGTAEERAEALARWGVGVGTLGVVVAAAQSDRITGAAPDDPEVRRAWEADGRREYSVRVGDQWVSYGRFAPLGTMLGVLADFALVGGKWPQNERNHAAMNIGISMIHVLENQPFLHGVFSLVDALSNPTQKLGSYLSDQAFAMVPFSSANRQLNRSVDFFGLIEQNDALKDTKVYDPDGVIQRLQGMMRDFRSQLFRGGEELPVYRNVYGETVRIPSGAGWDVISPFYSSDVSKRPSAAELSRLAFPFSGKRFERYKNVRLSPKQKERYLELTTTTKIRGRTLGEALDFLVQTPAYQNQSDGDPTPGKEGGRRLMIRDMIESYQAAAGRALARSDENVRENTRRHAVRSKLIARGHEPSELPATVRYLLPAKDLQNAAFVDQPPKEALPTNGR